MANRNFSGADRHCYTVGVVDIDCSVVLQGTGATTLMRGEGVTSVAYAGATGQLLVTLQDGFRYVISSYADLEDLAALSTPDGAYATIGPMLNEGVASTPVSFNIYTWNKSGAATNYTGRRLKFGVVLKNSSVGK